MKKFKEWFEIKEAIVKTSDAGSAIKQTLQFKIEDAEWIKFNLEKKGWNTGSGIKDSFDFSLAFHHPKIKKPAFFFLRAFAIVEDSQAEYDSVKGGESMKIDATFFLFNGKTGLSGISDNVKNLRKKLEIQGNIKLSERSNKLQSPGEFLNGPSLKTPLELAEWVNKTIIMTDIDGFDDDEQNDEDVPDDPSPVTNKNFATA